MWTLSFLVSIFCTLHYAQSACGEMEMICENQAFNVSDVSSSLLLRAPETSLSCQNYLTTDPVSCVSIANAAPGQKIKIQKYLTFKLLGDCETNFLLISDTGDRTASRTTYCQTPDGDMVDYTTVTHSAQIEFMSSDSGNGLGLKAVAFGCPLSALPIKNAELSVSDFGYLDVSYKATATCLPGYLYNNIAFNHTMTCRRNQNLSYGWTDPQNSTSVTCLRAECPEPSVLENGSLTLSNQLFQDSVLTYSCAVGYKMVGNPIQSCMVEHGRGAYWDGANATCEIMDCGEPITPPDSVVISEDIGTKYGSQFTYKCFENYIPTVDQIAECTADGTWRYDSCIQLVCEAPAIPSDWTIALSSDSYPVGSTLTFQCDLDGSTVAIQCQASESTAAWNTTIPACQQPVISPVTQRNTSPVVTRRPPMIATSIPRKEKDQSEDSIQNAGAIIGGIVAGFATMAIIIVAICCLRRKQSRKEKKPNSHTAELTISNNFAKPPPEDVKPAKPKRIFTHDSSDPSEHEEFIKPSPNNNVDPYTDFIKNSTLSSGRARLAEEPSTLLTEAESNNSRPASRPGSASTPRSGSVSTSRFGGTSTPRPSSASTQRSGSSSTQLSGGSSPQTGRVIGRAAERRLKEQPSSSRDHGLQDVGTHV